jgi:hypothetical protein
MASVIQLAVGVFTRSLSVKDRTKFSESHQPDQHFGENKSIDIGKSQIHRNDGNARINKMSPMRPGLPKINEKVCISRNVEDLETDFHIAVNACCID